MSDNILIRHHVNQNSNLFLVSDPDYPSEKESVVSVSCYHPHLQALFSDGERALLPLIGDLAQVAKRRDADLTQDEYLHIHSSKRHCRRSEHIPQLKWQRRELYQFITSFFCRNEQDIRLEAFYSGGKAIRFACGEEVYPKVCDTDIKVFITGEGTRILESCVYLVTLFIKRKLAAHYRCRIEQISEDLVDKYMPENMIRYVVNPENGLNLVSLTFADDDWVFIQSAQLMHTSSGKSLLCPLQGDYLLSLEGDVFRAIDCAKSGIIEVKEPSKIQGRGPLAALWELQTHGWAPKDARTHAELRHQIVSVCLSNTSQISKHCDNHRYCDYVASTAFLLTGFIDIAASSDLSGNEKTSILLQITTKLRQSLDKGGAALKDASPFLFSITLSILKGDLDPGLLAAKILFFMNILPHEAHLSGRGERKASPDDTATLSEHLGFTFLLIPRKTVQYNKHPFTYPDRCYMSVTGQLQDAWRCLSSSSASPRGRVLWSTLTVPLTIADITQMLRLLRDKEYHALAVALIGDAEDLSFFSLLPQIGQPRNIVKGVIAKLAESFSDARGAMQGSRSELIWIELKLMVLQIPLVDKKKLPQIAERLVALLGSALLCGEDRGAMADAIKHLLGAIGRSECELPDLSLLHGHSDPVEYLLQYYQACEGCRLMAHLSVRHYQALAKESPALFASISPRLLVATYESGEILLFEKLWSSVLDKDTAALLKQCVDGSTLAMLVPRILEIDSSTSQIYAICQLVPGAMATMSTDEAGDLFRLLLETLIKEGSPPSYSQARTLYDVAVANRTFPFSERVAFFKEIARYTIDHEPMQIEWVFASTIAICRRAKERDLLDRDADFCLILVDACRRTSPQEQFVLSKAPVAFILLSRNRHYEIALELYRNLLTSKAMTPAIEAAFTYAALGALLKEANAPDEISLAYNLWLSGSNLQHPNEKYRKAVVALFLDWAKRAKEIPLYWQVPLCQAVVAAAASVQDRIDLSDKLLSIPSVADGTWQYLSLWLFFAGQGHAPAQERHKLTSCQKRLCEAIGSTHRAREIPLEDRLAWLSAALQDPTYLSEEYLSRWFFETLDEYNRAAEEGEGISSSLNSNVITSITSATNSGLVDVASLGAESLEIILDAHLFIFSYEQGQEAIIYSFLDDCDRHPNFPRELDVRRRVLRRALTAAQISQATNISQIQALRKKIDQLKQHKDLSQGMINQLYRCCIERLTTANTGVLRSIKRGLREGINLLQQAISEQYLSRSCACECVAELLKLIRESGDVVVGKLGWGLITDPAVRESLDKEGLWIEEIESFISWYGELSLDAAEEVFEYLERIDASSSALLAEYKDLYFTAIVASRRVDAGQRFIQSFYRFQKRIEAVGAVIGVDEVPLFPIIEALSAISANIYQGAWSKQNLSAARQSIAWLSPFQSDLLIKDKVLTDEQACLIAIADLIRYYASYFSVHIGKVPGIDSPILPISPEGEERLIGLVVRAMAYSEHLPMIGHAVTFVGDDLLYNDDISNDLKIKVFEELFSICARIRPRGSAPLSSEEVDYRLSMSQMVADAIRSGKLETWSPETLYVFVAEYINELIVCLEYLKLGGRGGDWDTLDVIYKQWRFLFDVSDTLWESHQELFQQLWMTLCHAYWANTFEDRRMMYKGYTVLEEGLMMSDEAPFYIDPSLWFDPLSVAVRRHIEEDPYGIEVGDDCNSVAEFWTKLCLKVTKRIKGRVISPVMKATIEIALDHVLANRFKDRETLWSICDCTVAHQSLPRSGNSFIVDKEGRLERGFNLFEQLLHSLKNPEPDEDLSKRVVLFWRTIGYLWVYTHRSGSEDDLARCKEISDRFLAIAVDMSKRKVIDQEEVIAGYSKVIEFFRSSSIVSSNPGLKRWLQKHYSMGLDYARGILGNDWQSLLAQDGTKQVKMLENIGMI